MFKSLNNWGAFQFIIFVILSFILILEIYGNIGNSNVICAKENEINPKILAKYRSQISLRKQSLKNVPDDKDNYAILYNVLVPEVFCRNLIRIGRVTDGGKWICNPTAIFSLEKCTIYSMGIRNDPSFDEDIQQLLSNKCQLRSFDKNPQNKNTLQRIAKSNGIFMKALISKSTNNRKNEFRVKDIMSKFGDTRIDILKIDIEGAEFEISDELVSSAICQILIEIHGATARKTLELLQKFSKNGYYLFSYEINGAILQLSEYSFIHQSCLSDYQVSTIFGKYLS